MSGFDANSGSVITIYINLDVEKMYNKRYVPTNLEHLLTFGRLTSMPIATIK